MKRAVTIWSEGSRLAGDLFVPDDHEPGQRLPAILLCHGWGGLKSHLSTAYAPWFCKQGFVCLTFDYRGWGESDGKLISAADTPPLTQAGVVTVSARVIREVVDPLDQALDIRNAFDFLIAEPSVDPSRVGLWGSSFGGGHVVHAAAHDTRVKCVVAQVGGMGPPAGEEFAHLAQERASAKARGEMDPPVPQGVDATPGLNGTPDLAKMFWYRPAEVASRIGVPTMVIDAEREELMDRRQHGLAVYEAVKDNVPAHYEVYPCTHYQIYDAYRVPASELAVGWFRKYL